LGGMLRDRPRPSREAGGLIREDREAVRHGGRWKQRVAMELPTSAVTTPAWRERCRDVKATDDRRG
jgi:hypothetical protein